ncbi:MAG TPA: response regulator [Polyangia bacterium]|nr:response regulator [Polyangia bacterium]
MRGPVLVVDDDFDIRAMIAQILELEGFEVISAPSGQAALERLRDGAAIPRVILLDLMMPHMDGWEFRSRQLADPRLAAIPVVVLSGHPAVLEKALELGAAGALKKPVQLLTLLETVSRYCREEA